MKTTYKIDPAHSSVHFTVRHMMVTNVRGAFSSVQGTVTYDPDDPGAGSVDAVIDAASINTNVADRDAHLKSGDFLDVAKYPNITFKGKKLARSGDDEWNLTGDLSMHGVTKEVVLKVEGPTPESKDPYGNLRIGAAATAKIKRSDFGLTWNAALETGGILVGEDVAITLEAQFVKA